MSSEPDALNWAERLEAADKRYCMPMLHRAAAELRRQHAENETLRKQVGAYKMLERAQTEQLSALREQQDKFREAVASLQSERDANAIPTAEREADRAAMREALEALEAAKFVLDAAMGMQLVRIPNDADGPVVQIPAAIASLRNVLEGGHA